MTSQTKTKGKDSSDVKQFDKVQEKDSESKHISTKTNLWKFNPKQPKNKTNLLKKQDQKLSQQKVNAREKIGSAEIKVLQKLFIILQMYQIKQRKSKKQNKKIKKWSSQLFLSKFRQLVNTLTNQTTQKLKYGRLRKEQVLSWLTNYLKACNKIQYLQENKGKISTYAIKNILFLLSLKQKLQQQNLIEQKNDNQETLLHERKTLEYQKQLLQWFKNFIKQYKPQLDRRNISNVYKQLQSLIYKDQIESTKMQETQVNKFNSQTRQKLAQSKFQRIQLKSPTQSSKHTLKVQKCKKGITKLQNQKVLSLAIQNPKCPNPKCKQLLISRKCGRGNHMIVVCDSCNWMKHVLCVENQQAEDQSNFLQNLPISVTGNQLQSFTFRRLQKMKNQNNLEQTIQSLGYTYIKKPVYIPGTPQNIECNYPILSKNVAQQVYKNRRQQRFLPLKIRPSQIEGAGFGVFATTDIDKDVLVCCYLGQIGIGSLTPALRTYNGKKKLNNSIFTLGWFDDQIMIIAPNKFSNVGRFINFNSQSKCNLKPNICVLSPTKSSQTYQIGVIFTSIRKIKAHEQLFYNYGNYYQS